MSLRVTVRDLIDALEDLDENAEIRIVHQQNWPLVEVIGGIFEADEQQCGECGEPADAEKHDPSDGDHPFETPAGAGIVYLVANGHPSEGSPYGDKGAWEGMRRL